MIKFSTTDRHRKNLASPQQQWRRDIHRCRVARFAGHRLVAKPSHHETWTLYYLGFYSQEFGSLESAQSTAPDFARQVLEYMIKLIDSGSVDSILGSVHVVVRSAGGESKQACKPCLHGYGGTSGRIYYLVIDQYPGFPDISKSMCAEMFALPCDASHSRAPFSS